MIRKLFSVLALSCALFGIHAENPAPLYGQRSTLFEIMEIDSTSIVMLGNSLTNGCEWHELLGMPNVLNRGISGDTTKDIDERLSPIVKGQPAKIFFMSGVNDISHDLSADSVATDIIALIDRIHTESPTTKLYFQSLLPINNSFGKYKRLIGKEQIIRDVNALVEKACVTRNVPFINLHVLMTDDDGNLRPELTNDGLHLLGPAYLIWKDALMPYLVE